jgi:hypothetical protein
MVMVVMVVIAVDNVHIATGLEGHELIDVEARCVGEHIIRR